MTAKHRSILAAVRTEPAQAASDTMLEKHYTVEALAEIWGYDPSTIRRVFAGVTGVVRIKRAMRIPESVARAKYQEMLG